MPASKAVGLIALPKKCDFFLADFVPFFNPFIKFL